MEDEMTNRVMYQPTPKQLSKWGTPGDNDIDIRELSIEPPAPTPRRGFGARGTRYDEPCETCWNTTEICNHCGNCRNHCQC